MEKIPPGIPATNHAQTINMVLVMVFFNQISFSCMPQNIQPTNRNKQTNVYSYLFSTVFFLIKNKCVELF
jgi:hypothetical protein